MLHQFYQNLVQISGRINRLEEIALQDGLQEAITASEIKIIHAIGPDGAVKMGNIAVMLGITLATLTVACDKLESRGFVTRRRDASDRRTVCITLTEKGLVAYRYHNSFVNSLFDVLEKDLTGDEKSALWQGLLKLSNMFASMTEESLHG